MGRSLISIHAPRLGSDAVANPYRYLEQLISIHAPRMGSDLSIPDLLPTWDISIHAPRMGSDSRYIQINICKFAYFTQLFKCICKY